MKRVSIVNRKGGVAKTTTAVNLAAGLAAHSRRVLLVDTDSQANATSLLTEEFHATLYHALTVPDLVSPDDCIYQARPNLWIMPADRRLVSAQVVLAVEKRRDALHEVLRTINRSFDYVIIDTPPSEDSLFHNALFAADTVIIPIKCDYLSYLGAAQMLEIVGAVDCEIAGLLPTFYDSRQQVDRLILENLRRHFPKLVLDPIRKNVDLTKAQTRHETIFEYAKDSAGAQDYELLIRRF